MPWATQQLDAIEAAIGRTLIEYDRVLAARALPPAAA